uniref:Secreted protein n=1 Tax=Leishmania guyanensis TaxID=5670 RepID=A0A1E1IWZ0_LEIGU|nr:Hypothetical protein BN36_2333190 [Leishmania guyanensis]
MFFLLLCPLPSFLPHPLFLLFSPLSLSLFEECYPSSSASAFPPYLACTPLRVRRESDEGQARSLFPVFVLSASCLL